MDKKQAIHEILWMGVDDWTGLWEASWRLNTLSPELSVEQAEAQARALLGELVAEGLVYLCHFDEDSNEERKISLKSALLLLKQANAMNPPESARNQLRYASTSKGEERMSALEAESARSNK